MSPLLAAGAVLLAFAAAWEVAGALGAGGELGSMRGRGQGALARAAERLGVRRRVRRAGLEHLDPARVVLAKLAAGAAGGLAATLVAPLAPPRLAPVAAGLLAAGGFMAPDALLEHLARRRRLRILFELPDALDLLAVGSASGRGLASLLRELAGGGMGPLALELGTTLAEIECGSPQRAALARLRERVGGPELGALAAALERSRAYGSPLAEQLHAQAGALRREARRRIEERAARAAPKIQLVVALVLVPSVLLIILAAIIAHSDALFGAL